MNCREYEADVVDLARGAGMSAEAAERAGAHMERCHICTSRFARERQLTTALTAVAESVPQSPRAEAIKEQLLRAFAERSAAAPSQAPALRTWVTAPATRAWLAAAAVLVLAVAGWQGTASWRLANRAQPEPSQTETSARPADAQSSASQPSTAPEGAGVEAPAPQLTKPPEDAATAREISPPARAARGRARPVAPASEDEVLRFVMLPTAIGLPPIESGRIVRVELPTAMLPAYGLDVTPDSEAGVVEADVLVGQDGQARAIRFVTLDSAPRRRQ